MEEIWKPVKGYDGVVEVSNLGRVRNTRLMKLYSLQRHQQGYLRVGVRFNGQPKKTHSVHRLVAETFIPNPEGKGTVNHIDGCPSNNCVDNLEWMTQAENNQHAYRTGLKNNDHLRVIPEDTLKYIRENYRPYDNYFGATPMARRLNLSVHQVSRVARGLHYKEDET